MWVLIVIVIASSQSYQRTTVTWPVVTMQEFTTESSCLVAAKTVYDMSYKGAYTACVRK